MRPITETQNKQMAIEIKKKKREGEGVMQTTNPNKRNLYLKIINLAAMMKERKGRVTSSSITRHSTAIT